MNILDRYIGKQIAATILIVLLALLGVDVFFCLVNELRFVGKGDYSTISALVYIFMTIPRKIYILFPWSALLGALLALGNLARNSELVAIRVATVSVPRIAWAALKTGIILTVIMFICGEVVSPATERRAQRKKMLALSSGQAIQAHFGTWIRNGDEFIHIGTVKKPEDLDNVTRYKLNDDLQLQSATRADNAIKRDGMWYLSGITGTSIGENGTEIFTADESTEGNLLDQSILQASTVKHLERLTMKNLHHVIKSRLAQDLNALEYQRAFWIKVMQPFAALVMIFLAVPFVFGPLRSVSFGFKILVGIMVGFSFHTLTSIFGPLTALIGISPMVASMAPVLMFLSIGTWMLYKVR